MRPPCEAPRKNHFWHLGTCVWCGAEYGSVAIATKAITAPELNPNEMILWFRRKSAEFAVIADRLEKSFCPEKRIAEEPNKNVDSE